MPDGLPPDPLPPPRFGPKPKPWFKVPPKPKLRSVLDAVELEKADHALRVAMAAAFDDVAADDLRGCFRRDLEKVEAGEIQTAPLTDIRDEHNAYCNTLANMDVAIEIPALDAFLRDEAEVERDALALIREQWDEDEQARGNGTLGRALPDILGRRGMLATYIRPDFTADDDRHVRLRLVDPCTIYPVWEGERGLARVYRSYRALAGDVIGDFGDPAGEVERKVRKIAKGEGGTYDERFSAEVVEYWDRHWCLIAYDGQTIMTKAHGYGTLPFVVTRPCFNTSAVLSLTDTERLFDKAGAVRVGAIGSDRSRELARVYEPFLWRRVPVHLFEQSVFGHLATAMRRASNPPVVHKKTQASSILGTDQINNQEGAVSTIDAEGALEPYPTNPAGEILTPLVAMLQQNRQTGMAPGLLLGQNPAAQTSGSAIDILAQTGFEHWTPIVRGVEAHEAAVYRRVLEIVRDFGDLLGPEGSRGAIPVPRLTPPTTARNALPVHKLTADMVERTGVRVAVRLHKFNPLSLGTIANGLVMLDSIGIADRRLMMRMAALPGDPEAILRRRDEDMMAQVPELAQVKNLKLLVAQSNRALALGDEEGAAEAMRDAVWLAGQIWMAQQQKLSMMGANPFGEPDPAAMLGEAGMGPPPGIAPPPPPAMPGLPMVPGQQPPPGVAPPPMPMPMDETNIQAQGQSMPGFGIPTGTNGGRPPGGMG